MSFLSMADTHSRMPFAEDRGLVRGSDFGFMAEGFDRFLGQNCLYFALGMCCLVVQFIYDSV